MDTSQQLRTAYEAAKAGNRHRARQIVKEILKVEPNNDTAWYLYARIAETRQISIHCLEKVLEINLSHALASQDLERFKNEVFVPLIPRSATYTHWPDKERRTTNDQRDFRCGFGPSLQALQV